MTKGIRIACCLLLLVALCPNRAVADQTNGNTITWLILDLPPFFITKGPDKGKGG